SPLVAKTTTTRWPSAAARAIAPDVWDASSSGWAWQYTMVDNAARSEQRRGEVLPAAQHPRVVVADRREQAEQVLARPVALVPRGTADQVDQAGERLVDLTAEQVEIGHERLRVEVVGV